MDTESGFIVMRIITVLRKYCYSCLHHAYTYCFDDEKMLKVKWEAKEYRYRFS